MPTKKAIEFAERNSKQRSRLYQYQDEIVYLVKCHVSIRSIAVFLNKEYDLNISHSALWRWLKRNHSKYPKKHLVVNSKANDDRKTVTMSDKDERLEDGRIESPKSQQLDMSKWQNDINKHDDALQDLNTCQRFYPNDWQERFLEKLKEYYPDDYEEAYEAFVASYSTL